MDPQQELFTALYVQLKEKGYDVYDSFLPGEDASYPFIYLADSQQVDDRNKTTTFGNVFQTIHVWHNNPKRRGTVSGILLDVKSICYGLEETKNFGWDLLHVNQQILPDTTTKQPLLHGVLNVEFKFN
ncbi:MAG: hypothetical protein PHD56_14260 [Anaerostipes sp.]|nr:hypothetical protein [Anaerostipes sp.]MDD3503895.1 hypothetical protein [Eubacteriales bacterium]MDD4372205.1 hypothetical protein [Anaerostipes sp.]